MGKRELLWGSICWTMYGALSLVSYLWDLEEQGRRFKVIILGDNARAKQFLWGRGFSHYVILLYWNFIVSLTGYCKNFCRMPLFTILLMPYLFCINWDWQGQECNLKCPKVYEINSKWECLCSNFCLYWPFSYNHLYSQSHKNIFITTDNP